MEIKMVLIQCPQCHIPFCISEELQNALRNCHNTFYCPNGHQMSYKGESEEERLRRLLRQEEIKSNRLLMEKEGLLNVAREQSRKRSEAAKKAAKTKANKNKQAVK